MKKDIMESVIELYDAAKDKKEQIKLMEQLGYGTKSEILNVLHDSGRALEITGGKRGRKPLVTRKEEHPAADKKLPMTIGLKNYFAEQLNVLDREIKTFDEEIAALEEKRHERELIYTELCDWLNN